MSVSLTVPVLPWRSLTKQSHPDITYTLKNTAGQVRAVLDVTGLPVEVPDAQSILGDFVISNKQYMLSSQEGLAAAETQRDGSLQVWLSQDGLNPQTLQPRYTQTLSRGPSR